MCVILATTILKYFSFLHSLVHIPCVSLLPSKFLLLANFLAGTR